VDHLGRISATINLTAQEANDAAIKNEFKGTTPDGRFHQPGLNVVVRDQSARVNYDNGKVRLWESKAGDQNLYHVSAASNVDSITITIPGRSESITLSREEIVKAKNRSDTQIAKEAVTAAAAAAAESDTTTASEAPVNQSSPTVSTNTDNAATLESVVAELPRPNTDRITTDWSNSTDPQFDITKTNLALGLDNPAARYTPSDYDNSGFWTVLRTVSESAGQVKAALLQVTDTLSIQDPIHNAVVAAYRACADSNGRLIFNTPKTLDQNQITLGGTNYTSAEVRSDGNVVLHPENGTSLIFLRAGQQTGGNTIWAAIDVEKDSSGAVRRRDNSGGTTESDPVADQLKLSVQAQEVKHALWGNLGTFWDGELPQLWQSNLTRALAQFPTVEARARLVEQVGPEKLGVLIYDRKEFQQPGGAIDMILEPLSNAADTLKSAVDTIVDESSRWISSYNIGEIRAALDKLHSLEQKSPGAMKLAAVYYSSKTGYDTPGKFDEAVKTLRDAVAE